MTANSVRLQQVMDALGINDLTVPPGLDGHVVSARVPPVVMIRYDHGDRRTRLYQARTPQLTLPDSIDVRALGEIGLRILGLAPAEAKQFAQALDWHTTLVLPVPPNASSFRQVNIGGHLGVLIEHQPRDAVAHQHDRVVDLRSCVCAGEHSGRRAGICHGKLGALMVSDARA